VVGRVGVIDDDDSDAGNNGRCHGCCHRVKSVPYHRRQLAALNAAVAVEQAALKAKGQEIEVSTTSRIRAHLSAAFHARESFVDGPAPSRQPSKAPADAPPALTVTPGPAAAAAAAGGAHGLAGPPASKLGLPATPPPEPAAAAAAHHAKPIRITAGAAGGAVADFAGAAAEAVGSAADKVAP